MTYQKIIDTMWLRRDLARALEYLCDHGPLSTDDWLQSSAMATESRRQRLRIWRLVVWCVRTRRWKATARGRRALHSLRRRQEEQDQRIADLRRIFAGPVRT